MLEKMPPRKEGRVRKNSGKLWGVMDSVLILVEFVGVHKCQDISVLCECMHLRAHQLHLHKAAKKMSKKMFCKMMRPLFPRQRSLHLVGIGAHTSRSIAFV